MSDDVLDKLREVSSAMKAQGAYAEAWGIDTAINYASDAELFGIGPPYPGPTDEQLRRQGRDAAIQEVAEMLGIKVSPIPSKALEQIREWA